MDVIKFIKRNESKVFDIKSIEYSLYNYHKTFIFNNSQFIKYNNSNSVILKNNNFSLKLIYFHFGEDYSNLSHYIEISIMKYLSVFVKLDITPHINMPLFYSYSEFNVNNLKKVSYNAFNKIKNKINANLIQNKGILISNKWFDYSDLQKYSSQNQLNLKHWKCIFFKVIYTLLVILDIYPGFRHNDLSCSNIFVQSNNKIGKNLYYYNKKYYSIPNLGYEIYISDFEFSNIPSKTINKNIYSGIEIDYGIYLEKNQSYDLHFFLNSIKIRKNIPTEVIEFIDTVIPPSYLGESNDFINNYRLINNEEIFDIKEIINNDFFNEFITEQPNINDYEKIYNIENVYSFTK